MSIKVQNYTNASISILTENEKILIDPYFTDGIYGGTWHNFPRLSHSEKKKIFAYD
jgi:L-ascorbate metabolism protein UlaG (beta-lactamase superfamily)